MKKLVLLALTVILSIAPTAKGEVSTRVCLTDGETLLQPIEVNLPIIRYPDIMVGTELTVIISSDVAEFWNGSLAIADANIDYGILSCSDYGETTRECVGSSLPAAGDEAGVWPWVEAGIKGLDLYTGSTGVEIGDWFIIDYTATKVGNCKVGLYDYSINLFGPVYYLTLSHVQTRDFDDDANVNFIDFAILASHWQEMDCNDPDWCEGTDLDANDSVDIYDLILFCDYWLETTK